MFGRWYFQSRQLVLVVFRAATGEEPPFRGGRQARRDRWYGLKRYSDFASFREWWHRVGKDEAGGADLGSRAEAEAAYQMWTDLRRSGKGA
jgi:hypothetical protein